MSSKPIVPEPQDNFAALFASINNAVLGQYAIAIAFRRVFIRLNRTFDLDLPVPTRTQAYLLTRSVKTVLLGTTRMPVDIRQRFSAETYAANRAAGIKQSDPWAQAGKALFDWMESKKPQDPVLPEDVIRHGPRQPEGWPGGLPDWAATTPQEPGTRKRPTPPPVMEGSTAESPTPDPLERDVTPGG